MEFENGVEETKDDTIEYLYGRAEEFKNNYELNFEGEPYFSNEDPSEIKSKLLNKIRIHNVNIDQFLVIDRNNQSIKINFLNFEDQESKKVAELIFKLCFFAQIRRYEIIALKDLYCLSELLDEYSRTESIILQANSNLEIDSLLLTFFLKSIINSPKFLGIEFSMNGFILVVLDRDKARLDFQKGINAFFKRYSLDNERGIKSKQWMQREFYLRYQDDFFVKNRNHLELIEIKSDLIESEASCDEQREPLIFSTYKLYKQLGIECNPEDLIRHVETKIFPHNDLISMKYLIANGWFDSENYEEHARNELFSKLIQFINVSDLLSNEDDDYEGESTIFYDFFIDQYDRVDFEGKSPLVKALELLKETIDSESIDNELVERLKNNIFLIIDETPNIDINLVELSYTAKFYECTELLLVKGAINRYGLTSARLRAAPAALRRGRRV